VKAQAIWTFAGSGACEVLTISKHHTWPANRYGDVGTYAAGGKSLL
jgi:S-adenosylmethionine/arginine decarboxylase-like enzyme